MPPETASTGKSRHPDPGRRREASRRLARPGGRLPSPGPASRRRRVGAAHRPHKEATVLEVVFGVVLDLAGSVIEPLKLAPWHKPQVAVLLF